MLRNKVTEIIKNPLKLMEHLMNITLELTLFPLLRKSPWIWPKYRIKGCTTYNHRDLVELKNPFLIKKNLSEYYGLWKLRSWTTRNAQSSLC